MREFTANWLTFVTKITFKLPTEPRYSPYPTRGDAWTAYLLPSSEMKNKKKLIWNIFKTRKSFIEGRTTYKYRRIPMATITRIAGQPKIKIFLSAVKPFLTLREVRKGSGTDSARLPPNLSPTRLKSSLRRRNARPTALVTKGLLSGYRWSNCSYFRSKSNNIDAAYRSLQLWLKIKEGFRALTYQNTSIWLSVSTVSSLLHECLEQKL